MNKSMPLISVVMPVFNGEKYLAEAINSILSQTFTDFEFIIVNDGSTDNSENVILSYSDKRIKYLKQDNSGVGAALRYGCSFVRGKYIARMDADDISFPTRFATQLKYLESHPNVVLVSTAVYYIDEAGVQLGRSFPFTNPKVIKEVLKFSGSPICHPAVLMRAESYMRTEGYCDLQPLEDYYLWLQLSRIGLLINVPTPYLYYRVLNTSVSRSISPDQYHFLRSFLQDTVVMGLSADCFVDEFKAIYCGYEKKKYLFDKKKLIGIESVISTLLKTISLSESFVEKFICFVKNYIMFFKLFYLKKMLK